MQTSDCTLTNKLIKRYSSLDKARNRREEGIFVAEGTKCVLDLASNFEIEALYASEEWFNINPSFKGIAINRAQLKQISRLTTPVDVVAFFKLPKVEPILPSIGRNELVLALDRVQDPGNLGTIIRTADWMGVRNIVASEDTVDAFNPKVVQASMGALSQVKIFYTDLHQWLESLDSTTPVFGTFLNGKNVFEADLSKGVVVMGNEGQGIQEEVRAFVSEAVTVPATNAYTPVAESLNVAAATAVVLARHLQCVLNGKD